ncbi:sugar 3,4-ketoisomerase [Anoxybacillus sp. TBDG-1]
MYKTICFKEIGDSRGALIAIESGKSIPFEIKRIYYIFNTRSDVVRGKHAHKKLEQVFICLSGSCTLLIDDGEKREEIFLNDKTRGIYIQSMIWREIYDFSSDCVLVVLASQHYDEDDYIRDYATFLKIVKGGNDNE